MSQRSRSTTLWRTQNLIRDPRLVDRLLDRSGIGPQDVVYEIGAGTGTITERLAARARRVVAIEKEPALCATLRTRFAGVPNVAIRCADFLAYPLPRARYKVFANPPFDITTEIVSKLVSAPVAPVDTFLAVQEQAADRFRGLPAQSLYALLLRPWFVASLTHRFRREDFEPVPGVDIVMLRLSKREPPLIGPGDARAYRDLVVACFTAWRPTIGTALSRALGASAARRTLRAADVDAAARPRDVPFGEWMWLFRTAVELRAPLHRIAGAEARLRRQQAGLQRRHRTRVTGPPWRHILPARTARSSRRHLTRLRGRIPVQTPREFIDALAPDALS